VTEPTAEAAAALSAAPGPPWMPIAVAEELDLYSAPALREALLKALNAGNVNIVLDLSGTTFVDSSGFAVMVSAYQRVRAQGGAMRVSGAVPSVLSAMRISGLDRVLSVFPDLRSATAQDAGGAPAGDARSDAGSAGG